MKAPAKQASPKNLALAGIDDYIAGFPAEIAAVLTQVRATINAAAPDAVEDISYGMPCFTLNGRLVYFAAFKKHLGVYPPVKGDAALQGALKPYAGEKGSLRFPYSEPLPYDLIARVVKQRVKENLARVEARKKKAASRKKR